MQLVLNETRHHHAKVLNDALSRSEELLISIAFFKSAGLDVVRRRLAAAAARRARIRMFCGLDFWITDPIALLATLDLFERASDAKLYVCRLPTNFHPKLYCSVSDPKMTVLIGSANLSYGGLKANVEASAVETTTAESSLGLAVRGYFERLERMAGVEPATRPLIRLYERECAIHRKHAREAEQKAKEEIAELDSLQPAQFKTWLARYSRDPAQQVELRKRVRNYRTARTILNRLTEENIGSEKEFAALYDRLVGGGGQKPLWASGGLYRARDSVIKHYPRALALLRALKRDLRRPPDAVFEAGMAHARGIVGLGPNVVTEALTTWNPGKYPVLNRNPVLSLERLGFRAFPNPGYFQGATYAAFTELLVVLKRSCGFESLIQVNSFLNYVYWKTKKSKAGILRS